MAKLPNLEPKDGRNPRFSKKDSGKGFDAPSSGKNPTEAQVVSGDNANSGLKGSNTMREDKS